MDTSQKVIQEPITDVVELCSLLQCLGFVVKSLDTSDINASQDGAIKTVIVNCQSSGLHVVMESGNATCSCPATDQQNSGLWQVSGMSGGKPADKETGSTLLLSLTKAYRERVSKELREIVRGIKEHNETDTEISRKEGINKSASMVDMTTPEKRHFQIKVDTPTRYRSLDTLTSAKDEAAPLPAPGLLQKVAKDVSVEEDTEKKTSFRTMCRRQSTYTISSSASSVARKHNKTSSPIQQSSSILDSLIAAEKAAEDLRNKISTVIREIADDGQNDSSMSSLALDVSKISLLKGAEGKFQFASSPNLSGVATRETPTMSKLKRFESASTSNLRKMPQVKEGKIAKLKRLSPNIFKKKETPGVKDKNQDEKSKLSDVKPRLLTPNRNTKKTLELASPNLSSNSKKKFSHVKSTIPKPNKKEK